MKTNPIHSQASFSFTEEIFSSYQNVWKTISTPKGLENYHPFCAQNPVIKWGGVGARDEIIYHNGLKLKREFTGWYENEGYQLLIGNGEFATASVIWSINAIDEKKSLLTIKINVFTDVALKKYPRALRKVIAKTYLAKNMTQYVESVVKGLKYYVETGKRVKLNQFGNNKMFSVERKK